MKTVKKFDNSFSANLCRGMLESAGIRAFVLNENLPYTSAATNTDMLSIDLVVDDEDYSAAIELLRQSKEL
ncbi:MAG TPA: DUF2007 domain-containing protein [Candidatus Coprenecus stercoripullorum]|nr:DUF2007 domain-containing protein [Candidatus Coprenecus stercoripullorum]